jgi:hypothetical protein
VQKRSRVVILAALAGVLVVLAGLCALPAALRGERGDQFADACRAIPIGSPSSTARPAIAALSDSSGTSGIAGAPPSSFSYFRRSGFSHFQQCDVDVDSAGIVRRVDLTEGSDFDRCADRASYPRRFWLCQAAAAVVP